MNKTLLAALTALTISSSPAAHGQTAPGGSLALEVLDVDGDGRISFEEFQAARLAWFDRADTNRDGVLSLSELRALRPDTGERRGGLRRLQAGNDARGTGELRQIMRGGSLHRTDFVALGERRFARLDLNGDGYLDQGELDAARAQLSPD